MDTVRRPSSTSNKLTRSFRDAKTDGCVLEETKIHKPGVIRELVINHDLIAKTLVAIRESGRKDLKTNYQTIMIQLSQGLSVDEFHEKLGRLEQIASDLNETSPKTRTRKNAPPSHLKPGSLRYQMWEVQNKFDVTKSSNKKDAVDVTEVKMRIKPPETPEKLEQKELENPEEVHTLQFKRSHAFLHELASSVREKNSFSIHFQEDIKWRDIYSVMKLFGVKEPQIKELLRRPTNSLVAALKVCASEKDGMLQNMKSIEPIQHSGLAKDDRAKCRIVLDMDYSIISVSSFKSKFISELAAKLDVPESVLKIESVKAGSIAVVLVLSGALLVLAASGWFTYKFHAFFEELNTKVFVFYMGLWGVGIGAMLGGGVGFVGGPMGAGIGAAGGALVGGIAGVVGGLIDSRPRAKRVQKVSNSTEMAASCDASTVSEGEIALVCGKSTQIMISSLVLEGLADLYSEDVVGEQDNYLSEPASRLINPRNNYSDFTPMPRDDFMSELFSSPHTQSSRESINY